MEALNETLKQIQARHAEMKIANPNLAFNTALIDYLELGNLILLARYACAGALNRKESRGAHTREDYPKRDDVNFLKHTLVRLNGDEPTITIRMSLLRNFQ